MKVISNIVKYIVLIILSISIILTIVLHIFTSTILNKSYVLKKLEESNYYNNTYNQVESNFENYIYQSGLDIEVLKGIITEDEIKQDTELIIENIYNAKNEEVDLTKIKEALEKNIYHSLEGQKISDSTKKSIDQFINIIAEEYRDTIIHTKYEESIGKIAVQITNYAIKIKQILIILDLIGIVILLLLNIKSISKGFAQTGIALIVGGTFNSILNIVVHSNVKINYLTIFNNGFSISLRNILNDILNNFLRYGIILIAIGIVLIIGSNIVYCKKEADNGAKTKNNVRNRTNIEEKAKITIKENEKEEEKK